MTEITVAVGPRLFDFTSYDDWVNTAKRKFLRAGLHGRDALCVDAKGRVCTCGKEFMRARADGAYPIVVWSILGE